MTDEEQPLYGEPDDREDGPLNGPIDEENEAKVAKAALKMWESVDPVFSRHIAQWKVNEARRQGIHNARLVRDPDQNWTAFIPKDATPDRIPGINKAGSLCRRFPSLLFSDPPSPDVIPPTGDEEDSNRAEFTERALLDIQGETGLNSILKHRTAFDKANSFGSGYVRYYIDPRGAGRRPIQIEAHPQALTVKDALVDPNTGMKQGPYVSKYVRPDGTLTEEKGEAAERWVPEIRSEVLDGRHVRLFPHTVADVWEAEKAQCVSFLTLGTIKRMWPRFGKMSKDELQSLLVFRPEFADDLIELRESAKEDDDKLVFVLTTYAKACDEYADGLYLITIADKYVAFRSPWMHEQDGVKEPLMIPITQLKQFQEGRSFYGGVGLMELIGGADEVRAAQIAALLDHLEKTNNQKIFIPTNSIIQAKDLSNPRATVLPMNPGGAPIYQDIPSYSPQSIEMYGIMGQEMNDASGLQETGQGMEASGVNSGRQAYAIIGQVHAGLSEPRENIIRGYIRGCRIEAQLARAFYDTPRKIRWVGEDGAYKEEDWSGADLLDTTDIRIKPGTMTMLSPAAKAQYVEHLYGNLKLLSADEAKDMLRSNVGGTVGMEDDVVLLRIRRQLSEWAKGPPEGWQPPQPQMQMVPVEQATPFGVQAVPVPQPVMGPDGQPLMQPDPVTAEMFEPIPSDLAADIAVVRYREISRFMQTLRYQRQKPEWRAPLDAEFQRMAMAVTPQPAPQPTGASEQGAPAGPEGVPQDNVNEGAPLAA